MDVIDIARYLGALMLVLALVGFAALAARRYGLANIVQGKSSRRLAVIESLMLDARHKAVLIRRDDREHLVVMGPEGASVVEAGIETKAQSEPALFPTSAAA